MNVIESFCAPNKQASVSKLERHSSGLERGNTCSMLARYANDPCEEPGAAAAAAAGRNLGFGSFNGDEGLGRARKSTQIVITALQGVSLSSSFRCSKISTALGLKQFERVSGDMFVRLHH